MIRQFEHKDFDEVVRLAYKFMSSDPNISKMLGSQELTRDVLRNILVDSDNSICYVSVIDDKIVGAIAGVYINVWFNPSISVLQELGWYMEEQYRCSSPDGIRLIKMFEKHAKQCGTKYVIISTLSTSGASVDSVVKRMGYTGCDSVFYKEV